MKQYEVVRSTFDDMLTRESCFRAFDTVSDPGFTGFDKRFQDYITGDSDIQKRTLDALTDGGFTGFDKRASGYVH